MISVIADAFVDTVKMIPFLLVIYTLIGFMEGRYGHGIAEKVKAAGKAGPLLGTAFGLIPQCGFSVISTALYTKKAISLGTLLAVYLSTSDEAIPIIIAQPDKVSLLVPLLLAKAVIAISSGYLIDFTLNRMEDPIVRREICAADDYIYQEQSVTIMDSDTNVVPKGCCGHECVSRKMELTNTFLHSIIHTAKVFAFIFIATLAINLIIFQVGINNLQKFFLGQSIFQPFVVALIGLIPNCASSIAITEVFLKGGISFGSTVAGLSASAGLGLLVLFKESTSLSTTLKVLGLLFAISVISGTAIHLLYG